MTYRYIGYTLLLILIVAMTLWLATEVFKQSPKPHAIKFHNPDTFAEDLHIKRFDEAGNLKSDIYTPKLIHYSKQNSFSFANPIIQVYSLNQKPWKITAITGTADKTFNHIQLDKDVILHQAKGKNNSETSINTDTLNINTKNQTATTQAPVTVKQKALDGSSSIVKAVGIDVNQKTGEIRLLSHARGYYAPSS